MNIDNNPPAFPALAHWDRSSQMSTALQFSGMTLLDHFAGLAMQAITTSDAEIAMHMKHTDRAEFAYKQADAMLKERQKWIK